MVDDEAGMETTSEAFRQVFARFSRGFRFKNIFVKGSREQKKINFCVPRGPPPAAPPNRGPRGTQKLVRTTLTSPSVRKKKKVFLWYLVYGTFFFSLIQMHLGDMWSAAQYLYQALIAAP